MRHVIRFTLLVLSIPLMGIKPHAVYSQTVRRTEIAWPIDRGNPASQSVTLPAGDSLVVYTVIGYANRGGDLMRPVLQPTVSRSTMALLIAFSGNQTRNLPISPLLEVRRAGVLFATFSISVSSQAVTVPPGSLTLVQLGTPGGAAVQTGNQSKVIRVANVVSGYVVHHNLGSRLVKGDCFWEDTGLPDALWRLEPLDDNNAILRGPPGEFFTGSIVPTAYKNLTN